MHYLPVLAFYIACSICCASIFLLFKVQKHHTIPSSVHSYELWPSSGMVADTTFISSALFLCTGSQNTKHIPITPIWSEDLESPQPFYNMIIDAIFINSTLSSCLNSQNTKKNTTMPGCKASIEDLRLPDIIIADFMPKVFILYSFSDSHHNINKPIPMRSSTIQAYLQLPYNTSTSSISNSFLSIFIVSTYNDSFYIQTTL